MLLKNALVKTIKSVLSPNRQATDRFNCQAFPDNLGAVHSESTTGAEAMTTDRWNKIKQLFSAAQDRAEGEQSAFLSDACGDDKELKDEVEKLLAAAHENDSFLLDSAAAEFTSIFDLDDADDIGRIPSMKTPPRFEAGTTFNERYRIESLLGRGGMGEVYLAEDTRINRRVALKVLHSDLVSSKESLRRFGLETQAVSALNHPHIMTIYEFDRTSDGTVFFVAEYVDGKTLNRLIGSELRIDTALEIAIQVCSALSAAHEAGITHRDIKPENVIVRRDGYVKVLDFGLAKLTDRQTSTDERSGSEDPTRALNQTKPGQVMGTAAYMSPEQSRGLRVDARTDIWSVGAVVYEMLTGKRPFRGETEADVIVAVLLAEPEPVSSFNKDVPRELDWIVAKALSKDADDRYQTAKEFRADLEKIRKKILMDEAGHASSRSILDADLAETKLHSTAGGAIATGGAVVDPTNEGRNESEAGSESYSPTSVFEMAGKHKLGLATAGLFLFALIAAASYFAVMTPARGSDIDSIAVLPFENVGADPNLDYISDGLSESLIDRLSRLPKLKVISRKSSFKFRGADVNVRDAANQLGVRAIVTGSVTRIDDELVVRVEVVDALEDRHISGGQYRRKVEDLVTLENEVARSATEQLRSNLTGDQAKRLNESATENSEAFRYYLSGLVEVNGPNDVRGNALEYFERAVSLDPNFAAAHTEIAWVYWSRANESSDPRELMPKAKAATARALEIAPDLAKAHVLQAMVDEYEFDWRSAEVEYKRGIELSPNLDFARNNFAFFLSVMNRQDEALAQLEEQRVRDPINRRLALLQRGIILTQARRFDDALKAYQEAQVAEPSRDIPNFSLGYAYGGKELYNDAATYYKRSIAALGGEDKYSQPLVYLAATYARLPEKRAEARAILAKIETMPGYSSPALLAAVYSALGENDKAMELLEQAYIRRDVLLRFIGTGYEYDGLRKDARFVDLVRRIGLTENK